MNGIPPLPPPLPPRRVDKTGGMGGDPRQFESPPSVGAGPGLPPGFAGWRAPDYPPAPASPIPGNLNGPRLGSDGLHDEEDELRLCD